MIDTTRPQSWGARAPRIVHPWCHTLRGKNSNGEIRSSKCPEAPLAAPETPEAELCWAILRQALVDAGFLSAGRSYRTRQDTACARAWLLDDESGHFQLVCEGCGLEWQCVREALRARGGAAMG